MSRANELIKDILDNYKLGASNAVKELTMFKTIIDQDDSIENKGEALRFSYACTVARSVANIVSLTYTISNNYKMSTEDSLRLVFDVIERKVAENDR